ncbi:MAG: hypothetical protein ACTHJ4_01205 [Candidatus Nucleicultricaceae bacterium]
MFKNIALFVALCSASVSAFASTSSFKDDTLSAPLMKTGSAKKPLISKKFLLKTLTESAQKTFDIFEENIRVGLGTSEGRLAAKMVMGTVTVSQLTQSMLNRKTGRFLSSEAGDLYQTTLTDLFPEEQQLPYYKDNFIKKRPGYSGYALGMIDKTLGAFIFNVGSKPSKATFIQEFDKLIKAQAVVLSMMAAGHYFQTMHTARSDYLHEESQIAFTLALAGGIGHFLSSVALEAFHNYPFMDHYISLKKSANVAMDTCTKTAKRSLKKAKKATDDVATFVLNDDPHAFSLRTICIQVSYALGSEFGNMLHTINSLGTLRTADEDAMINQNARHLYGSITASTTDFLMRAAARTYTNFMPSLS